MFRPSKESLHYVKRIPRIVYQRKGDLSICFEERILIYINNYYYKRTDMQEYLHKIIEVSRGHKGYNK